MSISRLKDFTPLAFNDRPLSELLSLGYLVNVKLVYGGDVQAAINSRRGLYFPPGTYICNSDIVIPTLDLDSFIVVGAGITESRILFTHTGNGFVGPNGRCDHFVFQDISIENINAGTSGDGFKFTGASDVQTRIELFRTRVQGWGGWGYYSYNTQSSNIMHCHFRDNTKGHVAFEDDNAAEFSREPNGDQIVFSLLDNSVADASNVACVKLFNANGTTLIGNTIQGHWIGGGSKPAIHIEGCRGVSLKGNHIEAGSAVTGAAIYVHSSFGTTIENGTGSGLHQKDIELVASTKGTFIIGGCYINDVPNVAQDSSVRETYVLGGRYSHPMNFARNDGSPADLTIIGVTYQSQNAFQSQMHIDKWQSARELATWDHFENGDFLNNLAYWAGTLTGITRVATGSPPDDGPYVLINTQALADGGPVGNNNFHQTYTVPNNIPGGTYTVIFQFYVEDKGTSPVNTRYIDFEFTGSGFSGSTIFRLAGDTATFDTGKWYQVKIQDILSSGAGRTIKFNVNPTQGPATPRVRIAKIHLYQGKEQLVPDGAVALINKANAFWTDQYIEVGGTSNASPRVFGMGHKDGSGLQNVGGNRESARFQIGDAFNSVQASQSGAMVMQSFHVMKFYGHTFGGNTGSEAPIGFFLNNTADPHHEFLASNGGFSQNVSDNPNIQTRSASNSTAAYKHLRGVNSSGTERYCVKENGDYEVQSNRVVSTRKTGWSSPTGTLQRTDYAVYAAPAISNPPTQAEVQAIANALQDLSRTLKALIVDLHDDNGHGLIGN